MLLWNLEENIAEITLEFEICVRLSGQYFKSILQNYKDLQELWEELLDIVKETNIRSRIQGTLVYMNSFDFSMD